MKTLWTPWRMDHVLGKAPKVTGCLFEPPGDAAHDKELLLLYRDTEVVVLLNRFPYANGHLLVAPIKHVSCLTQLEAGEASALMHMVQSCTAILQKHFNPHGFNTGINTGEPAGAGISDHLHVHIVPRWNGDHNFMTVLAEVRTIPEHIEATFQHLLPDFISLYKTKTEKNDQAT